MSVQHRIHRRQTWRRFTLLDAFLIQASFAIGFSLACTLGGEQAGAVELATAGVAWGFVFAGPIVLMTQWTLRGRSRGLRVGEWLWPSPAALFALLCSSLGGPSVQYPRLCHYLFSFWVFAQVICMGVSLANLLSGIRGYRNAVPCAWTDRTGSWAGFLFGLWTFCFVLPFALSG